MHLFLSLVLLLSTQGATQDAPVDKDVNAIKAACRKAVAPAPVEDSEPTFRAVTQVWIGTLKSVVALRRGAECIEGAVLEVVFDVEEVLYDDLDYLTKGSKTVVVPTRGTLGDVLLEGEGHPLRRVPGACLGKLGLPIRLKKGRRYLVSAELPWEGEQRAVDVRRINSEVRKTYGRLIREAGYLKAFKAAFGVRDDHLVNDEGDHYEIIVHHPCTDDATGGAEQYIMDKKTGKWRMGWHEHPMPMNMPEQVLDRIEEGDTK